MGHLPYQDYDTNESLMTQGEFCEVFPKIIENAFFYLIAFYS
ncbi:hypothetical protein D920_02130 [Enterococcus faecalis 13-SD-W-01]|nr:hypothetical protein D920_02130 [Enterococcus faecalis 13-SD-W-01]